MRRLDAEGKSLRCRFLHGWVHAFPELPPISKDRAPENRFHNQAHQPVDPASSKVKYSSGRAGGAHRRKIRPTKRTSGELVA
jgi:hypothetical protein